MKILWVSPFLLHPTEKGAQIRTLGILRSLHQRHEVHFAALQLPGQESGAGQTGEYSSRSYVVAHQPPRRDSLKFLPQLVAGLGSRMPLAVSRYASPPLRQVIERLWGEGGFDSIVCDFLAMAPNVPAIEQAVLFQHNVETTIWQRHHEHASGRLRRWFFGLQAKRMRAYEAEVCRRARHVVAVSEVDAGRMREMFGALRVSSIATGVDVNFHARPERSEPVADLVFTGSMDWLPNVDAMIYFVREILPLIRRQAPGCSLAIVGRNPDPAIREVAEAAPGIRLTGTVPDVRPYLWGSRVAIVPLRIGGGTRLKIYEAMAAKVPVVSTTVGAEGLEGISGETIQLADTPEGFAARCVALLNDDAARQRQAEAAWEMARARFSWDRVAAQFEQILTTAAL
jgi:glycosyltransferase involved in cell wall biosynthesis